MAGAGTATATARKDPNNIYDAALAAGHYLCRFGRDLSVAADLDRAILSYNHSTEYLHTVLSWLEYYRKGTHEVPDGTRRRCPRPQRATPTPSSPAPAATPSPTPTPEPPSTPKPGGTTPSPSPAKPGGGTTPDPHPDAAPTDAAEAHPAPPTRSDHLEDAGTGHPHRHRGRHVRRAGRRPRPKTTAGKAVAKVRVRFTIVGDTGRPFAGGEKRRHGRHQQPTARPPHPRSRRARRPATSPSAPPSWAARPPPSTYTATVTARQADTLARTGDTALTCARRRVRRPVEVKATYKGAVADEVAVTATLVKSADDAHRERQGPVLQGRGRQAGAHPPDLTTDADGLLKLPKLYADDTTGTFLLRITTEGGATRSPSS